MSNPFFQYLQDNDDEESLEKQNLLKSMREINLQLAMNGYLEIEDLFDKSLLANTKIVTILHTLLNDRQKVLETKNEMSQKCQKIENEFLSYHEKLEELKEKNISLTNTNNSLKNKLKTLEQKHNEEIEKLRSEKEEYVKSFNKIVLKENQYKHENKKLERELDDSKARIKKLLNEKGKSNSSNNLNNQTAILSKSVLNTVGSVGQNTQGINMISELKDPSGNSNNYQKEFFSLINKAFGDKIGLLIAENEEIRQCLKIIYNEIFQYIDFKKLVLFKLAKDNNAQIPQITEELKKSNFKKELFNYEI